MFAPQPEIWNYLREVTDKHGLRPFIRFNSGLQKAVWDEVAQLWRISTSDGAEITANVLAADDPKTGKPVVDVILDRAGQKGTGKWSVIEAQQLGIPATAIEAAVAARVLSSLKDERIAAEKAYGALAVEKIGGDRDALCRLPHADARCVVLGMQQCAGVKLTVAACA